MGQREGKGSGMESVRVSTKASQEGIGVKHITWEQPVREGNERVNVVCENRMESHEARTENVG